MGLTSEQAKVIAARPRINPVEEQQMISLFADGKKPAEVALQFPAFAPGTIANLQTRKRDCRLKGGTGWSEIREESDHD
jgi:hypothetical protein